MTFYMSKDQINFDLSVHNHFIIYNTNANQDKKH